MGRHQWLDHRNWAVIGSSTREASYGHQITLRLQEEGYNVIPVSNKYKEVAGAKCYESILDYEGPVEVVDFVVNPHIGIQVLDEVIAKGVKKIMLQPGTASAALIEKAEAAGVEVLQSCVLVLLNWR